jgi:hypothetical protein
LIDPKAIQRLQPCFKNLTLDGIDLKEQGWIFWIVNKYGLYMIGYNIDIIYLHDEQIFGTYFCTHSDFFSDYTV